jgi:hypothetical protein
MKRVVEGEPVSPSKTFRVEEAESKPINVNVTIHNFFNKVSGPTSAPAEEGPENLFPPGERQNTGYVPYHGKTRAYRISHATRDGQLKAGCTHCTMNYLDMVQFAPQESNKNFRLRPAFLDALQAYSVAWEARDLEGARAARATIEELRNALCLSCQESAAKLSPAVQACKDEYIRMRKEACALNNGCANPNCVERGEQAWCVLQGDHTHTAKEEDEAKRKVHHLSDYVWWAYNGGVEAMRAEQAKGMQWICGFCHALEKTSPAANRWPDPDTMPDGKQGKSATKEEIRQAVDKHKAKIVYPKQKYIDAKKRAVGACTKCSRHVKPGEEWAFHYDHRDETTKLKGKHTLAGKSGGVAGLVNNCTKRAALDAPGFKKVLDNECDGCDLTCHNCHHRKTHGYPMRE